jgi:carboxymethylenebutenolidase
VPVGAGRSDIPAPIDVVGEMRNPILGIFAGADQATSAEARDSFEAALTMAGVEHRFVTYDGAPHSFFDRKADEFADASAKAWEETLTFVRGHAPSPIGA